MTGREGSSKRSHRICKACLMHGNHVHITLTEDQIILSRGSCHIQTVQIPAFIKNLRLRRVQIFRFSVSHHAPAKTDHPVIDVHDRKNHTVPEFIIHSPSLVRIKQSGFPQKLIRISLCLHIFIKVIAVLVGISKTEFLDRLLAQTSACEILISSFSAFSS